jgi:hypothetical protein
MVIKDHPPRPCPEGSARLSEGYTSFGKPPEVKLTVGRELVPSASFGKLHLWRLPSQRRAITSGHGRK